MFNCNKIDNYQTVYLGYSRGNLTALIYVQMCCFVAFIILFEVVMNCYVTSSLLYILHL